MQPEEQQDSEVASFKEDTRKNKAIILTKFLVKPSEIVCTSRSSTFLCRRMCCLRGAFVCHCSDDGATAVCSLTNQIKISGAACVCSSNNF